LENDKKFRLKNIRLKTILQLRFVWMSYQNTNPQLKTQKCLEFGFQTRVVDPKNFSLYKLSRTSKNFCCIWSLR